MTATETDGYHELTETTSEYKWTIYKFSSFNEPTGKFIRSAMFLSNGIKWCIKLYPNGEKEDCKEYISLILCCLSNIKIVVDCEFIASNTIKVFNSQKFKHTFQYNTKIEGFGSTKFIERSTVLADNNETDDILTIVVKLNFSNRCQETNYYNLLDDVASLLKEIEDSDVILVSSDGSEHEAHKLILACRSKVFSSMFQHSMMDGQDIVNMVDVDSKTLEAILHFVYFGELVPIVKDTLSRKLLIAADKYEFTELKRMCINYLHANANYDNVLDLIKFADTYSINELKVKMKEYFLQNHKRILSTERRKKVKTLGLDILEDLLYDLSSKI